MFAPMIAAGHQRPVDDTSVKRDSGWVVAIGAILTLGMMVLAAGLFLPHQTLWIDEVTQLSGLSLSPGDLLHWLLHPSSRDFGVPADRMPPLSYWLGWIWSRSFGLGETSMRWFGVTCAVGAVALVFSAARRVFGLRAGIFAGLFLALSPNVCITAVEIRAYPLFLLTSAGAARAVVLLLHAPLSDARRRFWVELGAWLVAGMYTHFFGALLAAVVVCGLAFDRIRQGRSLRPVFVLAACMAVAAAGLTPFLVASAGLSVDAARDRVREVFQLVYRLIGHPAMAVFPVVAALAVVSAALLLVAGWRLPDPRRNMFRTLGLIVLAGITISGAANFLATGFTAAKVTYATWALPLIGIILAASLTGTTGRMSRVALVAAIVLLLSQAAAVTQLVRNGDYFAHGPQRRIQRVLDNLQQHRPVVVHGDPISDYAATYYPLRFANPALPQFVVAEGTSRPPLGVPLDLASFRWDDQLRPYTHLIVVRSRVQSARQLAHQIRHGDQAFGDSRLISALEASGHWEARQHGVFVAFVAADVVVFERRNSDAR